MYTNYTERVAKIVLERLFPGSSMSYNQNQSQGQWDFDLKYQNGTVAAVEATSSHNQDLTTFHSRIFGKKRGGSRIEADKCKYSWVIIPALDADIREVRKNADDYLAALESEEIFDFTLLELNRAQSPASLTRIRDDLHLTYGKAIALSGPVEIRMQAPVSGGTVSQTTASVAASNEFEPNRQKLGRATCEDRHLFIYVDLMNGGPWIAMADFPPPNQIPSLPAEITHVWLAAQTASDSFIVWSANSTEPWKRMDLEGLSMN